MKLITKRNLFSKLFLSIYLLVFICISAYLLVNFNLKNNQNNQKVATDYINNYLLTNSSLLKSYFVNLKIEDAKITKSTSLRLSLSKYANEQENKRSNIVKIINNNIEQLLSDNEDIVNISFYNVKGNHIFNFGSNKDFLRVNDIKISNYFSVHNNFIGPFLYKQKNLSISISPILNINNKIIFYCAIVHDLSALNNIIPKKDKQINIKTNIIPDYNDINLLNLYIKNSSIKQTLKELESLFISQKNDLRKTSIKSIDFYYHKIPDFNIGILLEHIPKKTTLVSFASENLAILFTLFSVAILIYLSIQKITNIYTKTHIKTIYNNHKTRNKIKRLKILDITTSQLSKIITNEKQVTLLIKSVLHHKKSELEKISFLYINIKNISEIQNKFNSNNIIKLGDYVYSLLESVIFKKDILVKTDKFNFGMIIKSNKIELDSIEVAKKVLNTFNCINTFNNKAIKVNISIGISYLDKENTDIAKLFSLSKEKSIYCNVNEFVVNNMPTNKKRLN